MKKKPRLSASERAFTNALCESVHFCTEGALPNQHRPFRRAVAWLLFVVPVALLAAMVYAGCRS